MFTMRRKCDIILIVVIKEVRGYEKPEPTAWLLFRTQGDRCCFAAWESDSGVSSPFLQGKAWRGAAKVTVRGKAVNGKRRTVHSYSYCKSLDTTRGDCMIKKEMIAMLLAGGQGSRLGVLTEKVAKPAVAFGGKYRIIDFPLSNCINSGIDTVGVLTQYQPLRLNTISESVFRGISIKTKAA